MNYKFLRVNIIAYIYVLLFNLKFNEDNDDCKSMCKKNKQLDNVALVKELLQLFLMNKKFCVWLWFKNQGGNNFGDYHIIGFKDNGSFNLVSEIFNHLMDFMMSIDYS